MPWKFDKKPDGEIWLAANPPAAQVTYVSDGEDNQATVEWWAKQDAFVPHVKLTTVGALHRQSLETRRIGFKHYEVLAIYGPTPLDAWRWQGTTAGGTLKVKVGQHVQTYAVDSANAAGSVSGSEANLYQGLINFNPETREAEGVDIVIGGVVHFDFIQPLGIGAGTMQKFRDGATQVGLVSEVDHFGAVWKAGELLYLGGEYPDGRYVATYVTHHFAAAVNLIDRVIEGISGVTKKGWEVAWVEYQRAPNAGRPAGKPVKIHIEKVYQTSPWFNSFLGVPF